MTDVQVVPKPAVLYGPNGQPISSTNGLPTTLIGRTPSFVSLTSTALAAGDGTPANPGTFTSSWFDATSFNAPFQEGLSLIVDDTTEVELQLSPDATDASAEPFYKAAIPASNSTIKLNASVTPPFWIPTRYWRYVLRNYKAAALTTTKATLNRFGHDGVIAYSVAPILADGVSIRDTGFHSATTDVEMYLAVIKAIGNSPKSIELYSTHDQDLTIDIRIDSSWIMGDGNGSSTYAALGTYTLTAGSRAIITNTDFPGLDVAMLTLYLRASAAVAPTTGSMWARLTSDSNY